MARSRRNLPIVKRYIEEASPRFRDVVSGRGGGANHHPGNRRYWMKVLYSRSSYRSSKNDQEKTDIAQRIIEGIKDGGGRFVQRDGKDPEKRWFNLPNKVILAKVKQALRDQYIPLWAPVLGSKKLIDFIKAEGGQYIQYDIEDKEKQWFVFQDEERLTKVKEALQGWKIQYWVPERNKKPKSKKGKKAPSAPDPSDNIPAEVSPRWSSDSIDVLIKQPLIHSGESDSIWQILSNHVDEKTKNKSAKNSIDWKALYSPSFCNPASNDKT